MLCARVSPMCCYGQGAVTGRGYRYVVCIPVPELNIKSLRKKKKKKALATLCFSFYLQVSKSSQLSSLNLTYLEAPQWQAITFERAGVAARGPGVCKFTARDVAFSKTRRTARGRYATTGHADKCAKRTRPTRAAEYGCVHGQRRSQSAR